MRRWAWFAVACALGACGFRGRGTGAPPDDDPDAAINAPLECPATYDATITAGTYRVVEDAVTWNAARADCRDDGPTTHLVVLGNEAERLVVHALIGEGDVWLGVTDRTTPGVWKWVTRENTLAYPPAVVGLRPWKEDQPNGTGNDEDCVEMKRDDGGLWDDKKCDEDTNGYVCECDELAEDPAQSDPQI